VLPVILSKECAHAKSETTGFAGRLRNAEIARPSLAFIDAERIQFALEIRSIPVFTKNGLNKLPTAQSDIAISCAFWMALVLLSCFKVQA
jgi:hypothetical protein